MALESWRRNLYLAWLAQILTLTGFGFILPFIPLYMEELGVTDQTQLKLWVGLTAAAPGVTMAIAAPFWGLAADRFGRKPMIVRALASGLVLGVALALAQAAHTVFIIRTLQGLLTGTVTASSTLVAVGTPRAHLSRALGFMSSSTFIGFSVGPLIGGLAAELVGLRPSFFIGAAVVAVGLVLVIVFVEEPATEAQPAAGGDAAAGVVDPTTARAGADGTGGQVGAAIGAGDRPGARAGRAGGAARDLLSLPFLLMYAVLFLLRLARAQPAPFIPLYIRELRGTAAAGVGDAAVTGIIMAGAAATAALAGFTLVRLGDRFNKLWLIAISAAIGTILALPTFFAPELALFALFYVASGYAMGGIQPFVQSYLSSRSAAAKRGLLFGIQTMVGGLGFGIGPLLASWISIRFTTRHVFLSYTLGFAAIAVLMLLARLVGRRFAGEMGRKERTTQTSAAALADTRRAAASARRRKE